MKANFDQIDTDGDGAISAKELAEAVRKMKQRGAGGGPPGGPGRGGP
jgi:Ca2+-binding EF-hand superfamily protein